MNRGNRERTKRPSCDKGENWRWMGVIGGESWRSDRETHSLWAEMSVGGKELESKMRLFKGDCCEDCRVVAKQTFHTSPLSLQ